MVIEWSHWETQSVQPNWIEKEAEKIATQVGSEKVTLIAKSVGTLVAMEVLKKGVTINKLVLCGVPINDFQPEDQQRFDVLRKLNSADVIVFQNENDPHIM